MSMEKRLVIAFAVSAVILLGWSMLISPPDRPGAKPTPPAEERGTPTAKPSPEQGVSEGLERPAGSEEYAAAGEGVPEATEEKQPRRVVLEDERVRLELSSAGAVVSSMILKGYRDDAGNPLELIRDVSDGKRLLPLQLSVGGVPDTRLYQAQQTERGYRFLWSDGISAAVEKEIRLSGDPYRVDVRIEQRGELVGAEVGVGTGLRNIGEAERENRFSTWGNAVVIRPTGLERIKRQKVADARRLPAQQVQFAGFEDTYFLMVLCPEGPIEDLVVRPVEVAAPDAAKEDVESILQMAFLPRNGRFDGGLLMAPKEYTLLQRVDRGVENTLDFGFFHPISVFFLKALRWISSWSGNWGLSIILLTLGIRIVLFPLMHKSTVSMRRMQKVQPKVKAIQEKYKKNKTDPEVRNKMNREMMELYKEEGVNPMGGCLPLLIQLPLLWALYTLFAHAIELRHAPFIFWIQDLSAKDPYYVTPILMTFTMWLQQKLAPQAGDPKQQRIFRLMPFIFGIMFLGFPAGLVLYWLTNNVLTIAQQEITFWLIGERKGAKSK